MSARVVHRYVLEGIASDDLQVYVVWGPMQGKETEDDARKATVTVSDPRASHFWTDGHAVAKAFEAPLGLADVHAWDTFLVFAPGIRWGETAPKPSSFMHVGKPLPKERRLNGETLAREVRAMVE